MRFESAKLVIRAAALLCLSLALGCRSPGPRDGQPAKRDSDQRVRAAWARMRTVTPNKPYKQHEEKAHWWMELNRLLAAEFWAMAWKDDSDESVAFLARQFGKHGAEADMRLLLTAPEVFGVQEYLAPGGNIPVTDDSPQGKRRGGKKMRELQLIVSKVQVEMFLRDPELLDRYYDFLIWSRQFLGTRHFHWVAFGVKVGSVKEGFDRSDETGDYWWYARDFILLAHATSRDDLLNGADPSNLVGRFDEWHKWTMSNYYDLFPHPVEPVWSLQPHTAVPPGSAPSEIRMLREPAAPFENWDGAIPIFRERIAFDVIGVDARGWLYSAGKTYEIAPSRRPSP